MKPTKILLFTVLIAVALPAAAQLKTDWFNDSFDPDRSIGAEVDKAYELLAGREPAKVIVAVLDDGVDIHHPDLQGKIWTNPGEIPGNGLDDDGNGFVDDVHGWNFLGNPKGQNVKEENLEITRLYRRYSREFDSVNSADLSPAQQLEYDKYLKYKAEYNKELDEVQKQYSDYSQMASMYAGAQEYMKERMPGDSLTAERLTAYQPKNAEEGQVRDFLLYIVSQGVDDHLADSQEYFDKRLNYHLNPEFDPRYIVNETEAAREGIGYGNPMVGAENPRHGTHVAGIIGAIRGNGTGIDGVAANAVIMPVRVVPDGDERDKDVALGIRYAVDNGAKVINMSFGKSFSPNRPLVDDAIAYAADHDVLLIHAAGNDAADNDQIINYPDGTIGKKKSTSNWITVAAAGPFPDSTLLADFSNYGRKSVDILAPGVDILSLTPNGHTDSFSGTSMASPVVAGVATLIRGLRPEWSARKVAKVLEQSGNSLKNTVVNTPLGPEKLKKVLANPRMISAANAVEKVM